MDEKQYNQSNKDCGTGLVERRDVYIEVKVQVLI